MGIMDNTTIMDNIITMGNTTVMDNIIIINMQ